MFQGKRLDFHMFFYTFAPSLRQFGLTFLFKTSLAVLFFCAQTGNACGLFSKKQYAANAEHRFIMKLCIGRCLECTRLALFFNNSLIHSMMYLFRNKSLSYIDMSLFFILALSPCTRCIHSSKRSSKGACLMYPLSANTLLKYLFTL